MTAPHKEWTVLPHGKLTRVNERIVEVVGELKMPLLELPRRMTAVRTKSGGLVIFSAIALDEARMETWEIDHLGKSVVHLGDRGECEEVAAIIGQIGLEVKVGAD